MAELYWLKHARRHFLLNTFFFHSRSVVKLCSVRNGSSASTAVNERGEGTCVAVLHFHFMTACYYCIPQTLGRSRRFLIFPNNHRRQSKVLFFLFLLHSLAFPHFFSTFTTPPSISSLSQRLTGYESCRFSCQCRVKEVSFLLAIKSQ